MAKHPLTLEQRQEIERLLKTFTSISEIARKMEKCRATISSEIRKSGGKEFYNAAHAHHEALKRLQKSGGQSLPISPRQIENIRLGIEQGLARYKIREIAEISQIKLRKFLDEHYPNYKVKKSIGITEISTKISAIEMQIEILADQIKILNEKLK